MTTSTASSPLFTLHHGVIPRELLWEGDAGEPGDVSGWWVTGINHETVDEAVTYVVDEDLEPATFFQVTEFLDPLVQTAARRLLRVGHQIRVVKWNPVGDGTWLPQLEHERGDLTVHTLDGRTEVFRDLDRATLQYVRNAVSWCDVPRGERSDSAKSAPTVIQIDMTDPDGRGDLDESVESRGKVARDIRYIRVAAITGHSETIRRSRFTQQDWLLMHERHVERLARAAATADGPGDQDMDVDAYLRRVSKATQEALTPYLDARDRLTAKIREILEEERQRSVAPEQGPDKPEVDGS